MIKNATSYAMRNVPRYTSYPTAPHFHDGIDGKAYAAWLHEQAPDEPLSLYLHVPFCREICHYCGCHTKATRKDAPLISYAETLLKEIDLVADALGSSRPVSHIHWGGGTPSLLPRPCFEAIAARLQDRFDLVDNAEHAIELDPRFVTADLAATLKRIGVTRTSLGVQDFDPVVQKAIGRPQSFDIVSKAVGYLRAEGLDALNFDLMYGLPHQSEETILDTINKTLDLAPSRIALFGYAHVPWMKKHQRLIDEASLPDAATRIALADLARDALVASGYVQIGLDHFALPEDTMAIALNAGTLRRNFQGYTTDTSRSLVGFGVSSIGCVPQGYIQNASDVGAWTRAIDAGDLPIVKGFALSDDDRARAEIIESLMTDHVVDALAIGTKHGAPMADLDCSIHALDEYARDGLVVVNGGKVEVTETGKPYVRLVASAFDSYFGKASTTAGQAPARHSMAV